MHTKAHKQSVEAQIEIKLYASVFSMLYIYINRLPALFDFGVRMCFGGGRGALL